MSEPAPVPDLRRLELPAALPADEEVRALAREILARGEYDRWRPHNTWAQLRDRLESWVEGATEMLRGDVAVKGGITSILKTAHLAEAFRMRYEIHHGGNSLNNVASLHVLMAIPNTTYFEVLLPDAAQKYGLVEDIEVDGNGQVHAPDGPGLGYEIDFALIESKKVAVLG